MPSGKPGMSTIFLSAYRNCGWPPALSLASITSVVSPRWAVVRLAARPAGPGADDHDVPVGQVAEVDVGVELGDFEVGHVTEGSEVGGSGVGGLRCAGFQFRRMTPDERGMTCAGAREFCAVRDGCNRAKPSGARGFMGFCLGGVFGCRCKSLWRLGFNLARLPGVPHGPCKTLGSCENTLDLQGQTTRRILPGARAFSGQNG